MIWVVIVIVFMSQVTLQDSHKAWLDFVHATVYLSLGSGLSQVVDRVPDMG